jgi:chromosome segregation ATPase
MSAERQGTYTEELSHINKRLQGLESSKSEVDESVRRLNQSHNAFNTAVDTLTIAINTLSQRIERLTGNEETGTTGQIQRNEDAFRELAGKFGRLQAAHENIKEKVDRFFWIGTGIAVGSGVAGSAVFKFLFTG